MRADVLALADQQKTAYDIVIPALAGLSLKLDFVNRSNNSFQQLDNFDLYVSGSIRKILPATVYAGAFPNVIYQLLEYRPGINFQGGFNRLVGVDSTGLLWDIDGSVSVPYSSALVSFITGGIVDIPYLCQMQGYYVPFVIKNWQASVAYNLNDAVVKYSATDGNLYIFFVSVNGTTGANEPVWPAGQSNTVIDNGVTWKNAGVLSSNRFRLNWGILISKSQPPMKFVEWKYDPTNGAEAIKISGFRIGVSQPTAPINVTSALIIPNLNGYAPVSGRAYTWTYYNPNTLHDSSPAPFVGITKFLDLDLGTPAQKQLNGSLIPPIAPPSAVAPAVSAVTSSASAPPFSKAQLPIQGVPYQSYQAVYLEIAKNALTPGYGDGYSCIRCWATKDGGSTFFLLTQLYDVNGVLLTNADGSIPIAVLNAQNNTGYVPLPTPQNAIATVRIYDGSLTPVQLAPDPANLGMGSWTAISGNQQFIVPGAAGDGSGNAAIEYPGPVPASGPQNFFISTAISVVPGVNYTFQGYIDKANCTGGAVSWHIIDGSGTVVAAYDQANSTRGIVGGTFVSPASGIVRLVAWIGQSGGINPTLAAGFTVQWCSPSLMKGNSISTAPIIYPTLDAALTIPAPAALSQQPPPAQCVMGALYQDTLFLVDYNDPTRVVYSNTGDFNSYGINSFLLSPSDRTESIIEIVPTFERLLVISSRQIEQILSNAPQTGFSRIPMDPQHGSISYRGTIPYGSDAFMLSDPGIIHFSPNLVATIGAPGKEHASIGYTPESLISEDIQPLIYSIDKTTVHINGNGPKEPIPSIDNDVDLYYLHYYASNVPYMISTPMRGESVGQFSRITAIPGGGFVNIKEVYLKAVTLSGILGLGLNKNVYRVSGGTQDGTVTAIAVTQPLPTPRDIAPELWDTDKVFQSLILEGRDVPNFVITASVDGGSTFPYGPWQAVQGQNLINLGGLEAKQITLKMTHSVLSSVTPLLSFMKLVYGILGRRP